MDPTFGDEDGQSIDRKDRGVQQPSRIVGFLQRKAGAILFVQRDRKMKKKVPALLSLVGGSTYQLLRGLTAPQKPSECEFKDLVKVLSEHLNPKTRRNIRKVQVLQKRPKGGRVYSRVHSRTEKIVPNIVTLKPI